MYSSIKIGIIGNGNQSKRIQNILKEKKYNFYIYKPLKNKKLEIKSFYNLSNCDVLFIASPNHTHLSYLKILSSMNKYIFCEKPPVNSKKHLIELKRINSRKIYFNYNFRFLKICDILKNKKNYNLGNLLYGSIVSSHGLAMKKNYKNSWRSKKKNTPLGIHEIVSIHLVDIINYYFKIKKIEKSTLLNHSKIGNSFDTSHVKIKLMNDGIVDIFTTYYSSLRRCFLFMFENGIIEQIDNQILIRGPSKNFDKKGMFKKPKLKKKITISNNQEKKDTLKKSIDFFLRIVRKNEEFDLNHWNVSIKSNELVL